MNIWLDLRFLEKNDPYSNFIFKLVQWLIISKKEILFNIYIDLPFSHINFWENTRNIVIKEKYWSLKEQTSLSKKLKKYWNDLTIFFNYKKPVWFKDNYILFIPNLVDFHYSPKQNIFSKYFNNYLLNQNTKNAQKIICFNKQIKSEINDKLNIFEDNIEILTPAFNKNKKIKNQECLLDIAKKYNILWKYFLYTAWSWNHKNLEKIVDIFSKFMQEDIDLTLIILDDSTIKDLSLRKKILEQKVQNKIFFIWDVSLSEKQKFYENSLWSIFPSLYESFPFSMEEALNYNTPIIASKLKNTKEIFNDKIQYFNQTNSFDIYQKLIEFSKNNKKWSYTEIFKKYNISSSINDFIKIIDKVI